MSEPPFSQRVHGARDLERAGGGPVRRLVVAHRGASAVEAENTIPAFERAIDAGADAIELDVRLTSDRHLVVVHDPDVSRTTGGHGLLRDLTLAEVKRLRVRTSGGGVVEIPTLAEALACCDDRVAVEIELKNLPGEPDFEPDAQGVAEATIRTLEDVGHSGQVLLSSFNPWALERAAQMAPALPRGLLAEPEVEAAAVLAFAREKGLGWILPFARQVATAGERFVEEAHQAGISVGTWITDDPSEAVALFRQRVDAVATNDPEVIVAAVREAFGPSAPSGGFSGRHGRKARGAGA